MSSRGGTTRTPCMLAAALIVSRAARVSHRQAVSDWKTHDSFPTPTQSSLGWHGPEFLLRTGAWWPPEGALLDLH